MHLDLALFQQGERLQITDSCVKSKKAGLNKSWDSSQRDPTTQKHNYRCDEHGNVSDIIQDGVVIASYEYELIQDPSPYARLDGQFVPWLLY